MVVTVSFIGDVHGWSDRLARLLTRLDGPLVFMGDLIDRGPDGPGVLDRVRRLCETGRARCLMGNHEFAMLRGLGHPAVGIAEDPDMLSIWQRTFGGDALMASYRAHDAVTLRVALDDHLEWLLGMPWYLKGRDGDRRWLAVHAGLDENLPIKQQIEALRRGFGGGSMAAAALFAKDRKFSRPVDLPDYWTVVSGHTPLPQPFISAQRILCDTSGGLPNRLLSAVVWPEGRIVTS